MSRPSTATSPPWWRTRATGALLLLHAVYLFALCQLQLSDAEFARILGPSSAERTVAGVIERGGLRGTLSLYFGVHEQTQLYHRYAEVFLRGRDLRRPAGDPGQGHFKAYRDVPIEYQPGNLLLMLPPALLSPRYEVYLPCFVCWSGLLYLGAVLGALHLVGDGSAAQATRVLRWSLALLILFGPYVATHLDQAVALICVLAWAVFRRACRTDSLLTFAAFGAMAAGGAMVKIAPGVLLPAAGIALLSVSTRPRWREAWSVAAGFAVTLGALHGCFVACWGDGYLASYTYHLQRGIQVESTWAGLLMAAHGFGAPLSAAYNFGSYHLATPHTPFVAILFPVTWLALLVLVAWRARLVRDQRDATQLADVLPPLTFVLLLGLVLTSKVFSFNYLLWLTPLVPALADRARAWVPLSGLFALALGLTQFFRVYDYAYAKLSMPWPAVLVLNLRNFTLALLLIWLVWRLPQWLAGTPRSPASAQK